MGAPVADLSNALSAPGVTGFAYDDANGILYLSTLSGELLRWDPSTGSFLSPVNLGGSLSSVAVSPDGSFLLVGHADTTTDSSGQEHAKIDRVSVSTLAVQSLDLPMGYSGSPSETAGVNSVAITQNGEAVVSTLGAPLNNVWTFSASASTPVYSPLNLIGSQLQVADDGQDVLVLSVGVSPGEVEIYDSVAGKLTAMTGVPGTGRQALDIDANLAVVLTYNGNYVFDTSLNLVKNPSTLSNTAVWVGAHFSADGKDLFLLDGAHDQVIAYDTTSWAEVGAINLPAGFLSSSNPPEAEQMAVSADGRFLFIQGPDGVDTIDLSAQLPSGAVSVEPAIGGDRHLFGFGRVG